MPPLLWDGSILNANVLDSRFRQLADGGAEMTFTMTTPSPSFNKEGSVHKSRCIVLRGGAEGSNVETRG